MEHSLHEKVASVFDDIVKPPFKVLKDYACDVNSKQHLPFFISVNAHRYTCVSNVDLMIVEDDKVKLVCEIEESGFHPTKIYGKVFSTASALMSKTNKNEKYDVDYNGIFVQVMSSIQEKSSEKREKYSKKPFQLIRIESLINDLLSRAGLWIKEYHLIYGDENDFQPGADGYKRIADIIMKIMNK